MKSLLFAVPFIIATLQAAPLRTANGLQLPYTFEQNQGQTDRSVRYLARGSGYSLFLTGREAVLSLQRPGEAPRAVRMSLGGSRVPRTIEPLEPLAQRTNYFVGQDPARWRRDVPHYARVRYRGVYAGIDLVYHSQEGQLEYDFVVAPGASADAIRLRFEGVSGTRVTGEGDLELKIGGSTLRHQAPVAYQEIGGRHYPVMAEYVVGEGGVGFRVGAYDPSLPLVIDPVVVYSTYIGGQRSEIINAVAVDRDGNTYITGETTSSDFPQVGTALSHLNGAVTYGFVTKINAAGNQVIYSSLIGGGSNTRGLAIAVDAAQNVYLGGVTGALDLPLVNPVQSTQPGLNIGFVMKVNPQGDKLLFSTYLGGERNDRVDALAIDGAGSIYVTGYTSSVQFPVANAFQPKPGGSSDAFVAKFAAPDYRLAYSSFLGGVGVDEPYGIAVDGAGGVYVAGYTNSPNLATAGAYTTKIPSGGDSFVARVRPAGDGLAFYTYLGGTGDDHAQAIALEANGNILVGGSTTSKNFPVTANAVQGQLKGAVDAFLARMDSNGTQVLYATYLGGTLGVAQSYQEEVRGIAVDRQGNILLTGLTNASDFPAVRALQPFGGGSSDAFLTALNPAGDRILYSTPIGGSGAEIAHALAVDANGAVYLAGETASANFPLKAALRSAFVSGAEAFLTKVCEPSIFLNPASLSFVSTPGNPPPAAQTVSVSTCTAIPFTVSSTGAFLRVTPTSGTTNATLTATVDAAGLAPGDYNGTITVAAIDAVNSPQTLNVVLHVAPPPPVISAAGIVNAASGKGGPVSPGELIVVYGSNVGPAQLAPMELNGDRVATQLGGTRVLFDGVPAAMLYAAGGQVSAIVPYAAYTKASTKVEVERYGVRSNAVTMSTTMSSPALFTANASGTGQGAIVNQDGSVNGQDAPAEKGSVVILYLTGEGQTDPGGVDGLLALAALPKPQMPVRVQIDAQNAEVLYAGAAPGMVSGVMQVNVKVPASAVSGSVQVQVTVGGATSPAGVTLMVR